MENTIKIYTLEDPIKDEIRYIGMTTLSLNQRLSQHVYDAKLKNSYKAKWLSSLLKKNLKPKIKLLDECSQDEWEDTERMYIAIFKSWGFKLVNLDEGGRGSIINRKNKHLSGYLRSIQAHKKEIHKYNKNTGDFIETFSSINEAAKQHHINDNTITEAAKVEVVVQQVIYGNILK